MGPGVAANSLQGQEGRWCCGFEGPALLSESLERSGMCSALAPVFILSCFTEGSSLGGSAVMNPTTIHEDAGLIPGLTQWVKGPVLP